MAALAKEPVVKNDVESTTSYFKHSIYQKLAANVAKDAVEEAITKKLDVKFLLSTSNNTIRLADLGCAVGPNTFTSLQSLIDTIKNKCQCPDFSSMPEFQVYFNDQPSNDFNTLFTSLPVQKEYYAGGVPGSFHGRIFPSNYLHVVQCNYALHWLSNLPEELEDNNSPAWSKGKIHYANAPDEVLKVYARQWAKDFNDFLNARAKEIVPGGLLIVVMPSIPDGMPYSELANGILYNCFSSVLLDMAKRVT
ncbi:hypothetical protein JCGZ_04779 [Jatropha curcas]|uniref:S-adenosylmethionine-dependent methyltransferase n=2 Tax=Jatropha curcas TaxID=180498 RepID=A0A067KPJ6_JATCU|nr:hypothetical protein JCGZ_04779 [Jatropha curcas]